MIDNWQQIRVASCKQTSRDLFIICITCYVPLCPCRAQSHQFKEFHIVIKFSFRLWFQVLFTSYRVQNALFRHRFVEREWNSLWSTESGCSPLSSCMCDCVGKLVQNWMAVQITPTLYFLHQHHQGRAIATQRWKSSANFITSADWVCQAKV